MPGKNSPAGIQTPYVSIVMRYQTEVKIARFVEVMVYSLFSLKRDLIVPASVLKKSVAKALYYLSGQFH